MKKYLLLSMLLTTYYVLNAQTAECDTWHIPTPASNTLHELEFVGVPTLTNCGSGNDYWFKAKVKMKKGGGQGLHIQIFDSRLPNQSQNLVHDHGPGVLVNQGDDINLSYIISGHNFDLRSSVVVEMWFTGESATSRVDTCPAYTTYLEPALNVRASNSLITSSNTPIINSSSSFNLSYGNPFFVNLFDSKELLYFTVAIRNNNTGKTSPETQYRFLQSHFIGISSNLSNVDISNAFNYPYIQPYANKSAQMTVFIRAYDCNGIVRDFVSFPVYYKGQPCPILMPSPR